MCPCIEYPLKPHFYKVKLGYTGVYLGEAVQTSTLNLCFEQNKKNIKTFPMKIIDF